MDSSSRTSRPSRGIQLNPIITQLQVDAWWEDLNALRKDPEPMDWEYIQNKNHNHQFWDILKEFSERSTSHDIPHQSPSWLLYNIRNSISQSLGHLTQDINGIQADIEATTKSLSRLLSQMLEGAMATLTEIRSQLGRGNDGFWAERFREMDEIIARGNTADV
ncbi:hypothetical protein PAXRUDRAFT_19118 [Paxillus rubicundulus Ve08.2h10]|uniref:Uncharacterized protein n=1 Tax=Paxillus rubicundulus Ve08.2h10 TaxID=930991 RepID=A0A0D0CW28_9AGAM|nr:hypothetical protein PAXRUDRAFT_19118 [Paxillus rubicundulus Ve08.2h10]